MIHFVWSSQQYYCVTASQTHQSRNIHKIKTSYFKEFSHRLRISSCQGTNVYFLSMLHPKCTYRTVSKMYQQYFK